MKYSQCFGEENQLFFLTNINKIRRRNTLGLHVFREEGGMYCSALRNNSTELSSQRKIDICSMGAQRAEEHRQSTCHLTSARVRGRPEALAQLSLTAESLLLCFYLDGLSVDISLVVVVKMILIKCPDFISSCGGTG